MAINEILLRHTFILNALKKRSLSFDDLQWHLENQSLIHGYKLTISLRTFQRDIKLIKEIFGVEIYFDKTNKTYRISEENYKRNEWILDSLHTVAAANLGLNLSDYVLPDKRNSKGKEFFIDILTAIKKRKVLKLFYKKFIADTWNEYNVEPLVLKEFRYRWYLLAYDTEDGLIKTFGLDRIEALELTSKPVRKYQNFDAKKYFENFYGIVRYNAEPERIVLSFNPVQGKYIKTVPLHHSQKTLIDNDEELRIELNLVPTEDFIMDLLSHGDRVTVLSPESLAEEIKNILQKSLEKYN